MNKDRTDTTLADYVGIISRRKWFIGAVALVCAAAALGASLLAKPIYQATASLNVRDPNQDLTLLGTAFVSGQTPLQLATAHASQIERPAVLQAAARGADAPAGAGRGEARGVRPGRSELRPGDDHRPGTPRRSGRRDRQRRRPPGRAIDDRPRARQLHGSGKEAFPAGAAPQLRAGCRDARDLHRAALAPAGSRERRHPGHDQHLGRDPRFAELPQPVRNAVGRPHLWAAPRHRARVRAPSTRSPATQPARCRG